MLARGVAHLCIRPARVLGARACAIGQRGRACADELDAAATRVLAAGQDTKAPRSGAVGQGDVDQLRGVNLRVLGEVIQAFEAAHDLDASIPRLVPIATRRLLGKRRRKVDAAPAPTLA